METPLSSGTMDLSRSRSGESLHRLLVESTAPNATATTNTMQGGRGDWRVGSRTKTVGAALLMCLHLGVDPPDLHRTNPVSRQYCWIDTSGYGGGSANGAAPDSKTTKENILRSIQAQYEYWQPRARYKSLLDPTQEEMRKLLTGLRKSAGRERLLVHYNGSGVPRPTANGELWCFNRQYTQYIPLTVLDVHAWAGSPALVVLDCSSAGHLFEAYRKLAELGEDLIVLAACDAEEILPMAPEMPADIFTSCLTTPMEMSLRWHVYRAGPLVPTTLTEITIDAIPGRLSDRRTPLGELNWILTAILDTIAWCTLPRDLFKRLFRQDILVASLFRNYLLAMRILHSFRCTPHSWPPLPTPAILSHHLWGAWDQALDAILNQVSTGHFEPSLFFTSQMDAFEMWIRHQRLTHALPRTSQHLPILLQVLLSQTHRNRALSLLGAFLDLGDWAIVDALHVGIFPYLMKLFQSPALEIRYPLLYLWMRILKWDGEIATIDLIKDEAWTYFVRILTEPADDSIDLYEIKAMAIYCLCMFVMGGSCGAGAVGVGSVGVGVGVGSGNSTAVVGNGGAVNQQSNQQSASPHQSNQNHSDSLVNSNALLLMGNAALMDALIESASGGAPVLGEWAVHLLSLLVPHSPSAKELLCKQLCTILPGCLHHERTDNRVAAVHCLGMLLTTPTDTEDDHLMALIDFYDDCHPPVRRELVIALSKYVARNVTRITLAAYALWEEHHRNLNHILNRNLNHIINASTTNPDDEDDAASSISIYGSHESTVVAPGGGDLVRNQSIYTVVWKVCLLLSLDPMMEVSHLACQLVDEIHLGFLSLQGHSSIEVFFTSDGADNDYCDGGLNGLCDDREKATRHPDQDKEYRSSPSPTLSPSPSPSTINNHNVVLKSALPLRSTLISSKASHAIEHQKRRHQSMDTQNKSIDGIAARVRKLQVIDSEDLRLWHHQNQHQNQNHNRFDHPYSVGVMGTQLSHLLFHPLNDQLICADDDGIISLVSMTMTNTAMTTRKSETLGSFHALLGDGVRVTGLACVDWNPIKLLVSSNDGLIRLFQGGILDHADADVDVDDNSNSGDDGGQGNRSHRVSDSRSYSYPYHSNHPHSHHLNSTHSNHSQSKLLSAWSVGPMPHPPADESPTLLMEWNEHQRRLYTLASGVDLAVLDAIREQVIRRINTHHHQEENHGEPYATAMTSDKREAPLVTLAFSSGHLRHYDLRQRNPLIEEWQAQEHWIVSVKRPVHEMQLISASINGEVLWWDLRGSKPLHRLSVYPECGLLAMDVHGEGGLTVVAGADHTVRIFDAIKSNDIPNCVGSIKVTHGHGATSSSGGSGSGSRKSSLAMDFAGLWSLNSKSHDPRHSSQPQPSHHYNPHHTPHYNQSISSLAWHPRRLLCAVGSSDGSLSIYSPRP